MLHLPMSADYWTMETSVVEHIYTLASPMRLLIRSDFIPSMRGTHIRTYSKTGSIKISEGRSWAKKRDMINLSYFGFTYIMNPMQMK